MPIYEYRCQACGRQHEALQKVSDKPLRSCPSCSKRALKRLMSAPRFRLKGAGWYETDFKSDSEKKRNLADTGGDAGKAAAAESAGGGESAPAGDSAAKGEKSSEKAVDKGDSGGKSDGTDASKRGGSGGVKPAARRKAPAARKPRAARSGSRGRRA